MSDIDPYNPASAKNSEAESEDDTSGRKLIDPATTVNARTTRVFRLLDRMVSNNIQKYEHAQEFHFPFLLTEEELRAVAKESLQALLHIPCATGSEFSGVSRFADRSTQRFDDFEAFMERAGKRMDPESIQVTWSCFEISDEGDPISGKISLTYYTEKRLVSQSLNPDELPTAYIELIVSGSDQRWVDQSFEDIVPHIEVVKLAGILRPLWIFRNVWLVQVLALCFGWVGMLVSQNTVSRLFSGPFQLEKAELLKKITGATTAEEKLNIYYEWSFTPYNSPWYREAVVLGFSLLIFAAVYFLCKVLLPKLAPNSAIAIGLANRRAMNALDTFRFIIFTLIIGGFIAPVTIEFVKWWLS